MRSICLMKSYEESACQSRRCGFDPWVGKIPWRRKWQPTLYFCLGNPLNRGVWWAPVCGVAKSQTPFSEWAVRQAEMPNSELSGDNNTSLGQGRRGAEAARCQWSGKASSPYVRGWAQGLCGSEFPWLLRSEWLQQRHLSPLPCALSSHGFCCSCVGQAPLLPLGPILSTCYSTSQLPVLWLLQGRVDWMCRGVSAPDGGGGWF